MSIRRILFPISGLDDIEQGAEFAFVLARHHGAEVEGVFAQGAARISEWLDNWGLSESEIETLEQKARQRAREAEHRIERAFRDLATHHPDVTARFRPTADGPARPLSELAIHADITVLGNLAHGENAHLNALLSQSARPLLVAPPRPVEKDLGNRIVIAWNQSPEAARAVAAAMPLIDRAQKVVVVSVGKDADDQNMGPLREYLSLHAREVETAAVNPHGRKTGQVLVDTTAEVPGSILVMGAYSHHRWREQVLGGVTNFVLNNADIPALIMH